MAETIILLSIPTSSGGLAWRSPSLSIAAAVTVPDVADGKNSTTSAHKRALASPKQQHRYKPGEEDATAEVLNRSNPQLVRHHAHRCN
jgi:hypothetical protein